MVGLCYWYWVNPALIREAGSRLHKVLKEVIRKAATDTRKITLLLLFVVVIVMLSMQNMQSRGFSVSS